MKRIILNTVITLTTIVCLASCSNTTIYYSDYCYIINEKDSTQNAIDESLTKIIIGKKKNLIEIYKEDNAGNVCKIFSKHYLDLGMSKDKQDVLMLENFEKTKEEQIGCFIMIKENYICVSPLLNPNRFYYRISKLKN